MDIFPPIIEAYLGLYENYVDPPINFLEYAMEYEKHNKKWLLELEEISEAHQNYSKFEIVCTQLLLLDN
jgi:hypothetical protein